VKSNLEFTAIETAYRAYQFRSRLEAKYAVFFDLCQWSWSYEPPEFNGWIPDFAIGQRPTLVEVKPFWKEEQWKEQVSKIVASGCREPVVLLGNDPAWISVENEESFCDAPMVGWLLDFIDGSECVVDTLNFGITEGNGKPGLCPMFGAWRNVIWEAPECSHPNKWSRVSLFHAEIETELSERWAKASNASRWIPVNGQHRS
jgi:hypothetical protein